MPIIHYKNRRLSVRSDETLLDALLENKIEFPHSCKNGTCQSCLTKLVDGVAPLQSQKGLKSTLIAKNYFLACQCMPENDMTISLPEKNDTDIPSKIIKMSMLNHNVLRVRLSVDTLDSFIAGQYINIVTPENIVRSYSIANVPTAYIEIHVKLIPDGLMSRWLTEQAKVGQSLYIRGPMGYCFYDNPEQASFPIVLAGTGTGLAPLFGIAKDALEKNHKGSITLIHGGVNESDLYLNKALKDLKTHYENFSYVPCVLNKSQTIQQRSIDLELIHQLKHIENDVRLFICGPEETTKLMRMKAFLAGVPSSSIYSDSFIMTKKSLSV